ncbi:MAG: carbohydrate ABC transporter permease [Anaerolineaceae bacterium]|nr:MAG: carbohydrate ABC transporter permease [Anaerolineaceae bacterium]
MTTQQAGSSTINWKKWIWLFTFYAVLGVFAFIWLVPIVWAISMSFTPNTVLARQIGGLLPTAFTFENYETLMRVSSVPRWFLNSMIVSVGTTLGVLVISSMAGYSLSRINFRGKTFITVFILAGLMVPEQAVFIPLHIMFSEWGMHNTHVALMLPRMAIPLGTFIMMQFFRAIPMDIEEAASIDGANRLTVYLRIMLPLTIPALTTLGIFTFVLSWNDFLWPLVSATRSDMFTITIGLASLQGNFAQSEGLGSLMTSAVVASAPMLLLFLFFQRYIVQAVKTGTRF